MVSIITVGFAGGIAPAYAASLLQQQGADTRAQSTVILKQSLDILGNVLTQLENRLREPGQLITNKAELNSTLGAIHIYLTGIHTALANYNPSIATNAQPIQAVTPAPLAMPETQQPVIVKTPQRGTADASPAPPPIVTTSPYGTVNIPLVSGEKAENVPNSDAASVGSFADQKNLVWPTLALVVVLALIFFLRMQEKKRRLQTRIF